MLIADRCFPPLPKVEGGNFWHNQSAIPDSVFSGCTPSAGPEEVVTVSSSAHYASFDVSNAANTVTPAFSIDEHPMWVYAVDGRYVEPALVDAIYITNGARYSVLVKLDNDPGDYTIRYSDYSQIQIINATAVLHYDDPFPRRNKQSTPSITITGANTTADTVILDDDFKIVPFPVETPSSDVANTFVLSLEQYHASYIWTLGNTTFSMELENSSPALFDISNAPEGVNVQTKNGTWVDIVLNVVTAGQPTHPIHKHSNKFFVIGQGQGAWNYSSVAEAIQHTPESFNLKTPQIRDTFNSPPSPTGPAWLVIRYQVINPGPFLIHCHIQDHLNGGMALALIDGVDAWPMVPPEYLHGNGLPS